MSHSRKSFEVLLSSTGSHSVAFYIQQCQHKLPNQIGLQQTEGGIPEIELPRREEINMRDQHSSKSCIENWALVCNNYSSLKENIRILYTFSFMQKVKSEIQALRSRLLTKLPNRMLNKTFSKRTAFKMLNRSVEHLTHSLTLIKMSLTLCTASRPQASCSQE